MIEGYDALLATALLATEERGHAMKHDFATSPRLSWAWTECQRCGLKVFVDAHSVRVFGGAPRSDCPAAPEREGRS